MFEEQEQALLELIDDYVQFKGYGNLNLNVETPQFTLLGAWKLRSKINTAIAVLRIPEDGVDVSVYIQTVKEPVGQIIGYVPIADPLGLYLILVGRRFQVEERLDKGIASLGGNRVNIRGIHLIDFEKVQATSAYFAVGNRVEEVERIVSLFLSQQVSGRTGNFSDQHMAHLVGNRHTRIKARPDLRSLVLLTGLFILVFIILGLMFYFALLA